MGDASLRVQTKYPSAGALLHAVGPSLARGSLRIPLHVSFDGPFELTLASLDGDEPIQGAAEVIEHAGDATWIRFVSATVDSTTEPGRCVLVDTEVMSPVSLSAKPETFEAITAVNDAPAQLAVVPSGAAEPVKIASLPLPPPPDPLFDVSDASRGHMAPSSSSSTIAEAAAAACGDFVGESTAVREGETTMVESRRDVDVAALAALEGHFDALSDAAPPATAKSSSDDDLRVPLTCESLPLAAGGGPAVAPTADDLRVPHTGESLPLAITADAVARESRTRIFDAATALSSSRPALDDDLRVPHTGESPPLDADGAARDADGGTRDTELRMPALEPAQPPAAAAIEAVPLDRPTAESQPIVAASANDARANAASANAASANAASANAAFAGDAPAIIHDASPPEDQRPTVESPPIVAALVQMTAGDDAIAAQRGIRAITNPYAKGGMPSSNRRLVIAVASVAVVSLVIAAGSVMWAHDAVARAEQPRATSVAAPTSVQRQPVVEQQPQRAVEQQPTVVVQQPQPALAQQPTVVEQQPTVVERQPQPVSERPVGAPAVATPTTCTLDVFASVAESSVYVNGAANGSTPATASVPCGKPITVEIRHPRYEPFKRVITPNSGREELRATLEREKTSLHVSSEPAGASVTYNGTPIGKTPLTVKIPRYEQGTLHFSMAGMQADWRRIVPKSPEKTVTIALRKQ